MIQHIRPIVQLTRLPQILWSWFPVPTDLLHRVVKLNGMTIGIANGRGELDAGVQFVRQ